ncbi:erythromycin esterase family protein [Dactylosporangium sp. NPDC051485]|uniref:erythromycin esterase family protein n=1 Tax=Dactylosporangium sp. NPDC051485 TaxID=3154846 RepID=UPI003425C9AB
MTATAPVGAADLIGMLGRRPRLLALGEPTHGEDVLLELRNDLFRELVEAQGYRRIAIESDCLLGLEVDAYVTTGRGDLDDVMARGFSHGFGESAANRDLVRWMRAHNEHRPEAEQVRFAGFDGPLEMSGAASPRTALTALHARLGPGPVPCTAGELDELLGDDERWTNPAAMMDPSQSIGRGAEAQRLRLIADDLAGLVETHAPERGDLGLLRLYARTAAGLLRYHAGLADPSPQRLGRLCAQRDAMMAANLLALAADAPTLVHAHNAHLQRDRSTMRMAGMDLRWWSAGAIAATDLRDGYAFVATALGAIRHHGVGEPPPDTLEGMLYAEPEQRFLVDLRRAGDRLAAAVPRVSPWFGYASLAPAHVRNYDAIAFIKDSPPR